MKDLTRREFLNSAAGAAIGGAIVGHTEFLNASSLHSPSATLGFNDSRYIGAGAPLESAIFPKPQEISSSGSDFVLDNLVRIVVPPNAPEEDLFLARSLASELGDKFDLHLKIERIGTLTAGVPTILMGSIQNPLVRQYCALAKPASNRESFRLIWDQADTADLLGWYEIVYEDGFVTTIPIRYGVNIVECNQSQRVSESNYCYGADAVAVGPGTNNDITFFAYEWTNPRLGKVIQEIRLKGTTRFRGASSDYANGWGPVIENNAVILKAVSMVEKRT